MVLDNPHYTHDHCFFSIHENLSIFIYRYFMALIRGDGVTNRQAHHQNVKTNTNQIVAD